ncbi:hypothetical protein [Nitrosomonas communis]|uniref:hypothetical protein n=1 Tax=Nitrosomonas communis TaxID=44574 RepID=UPI003D2C1199
MSLDKYRSLKEKVELCKEMIMLAREGKNTSQEITNAKPKIDYLRFVVTCTDANNYGQELQRDFLNDYMRKAAAMNVSLLMDKALELMMIDLSEAAEKAQKDCIAMLNQISNDAKGESGK